MKCAPPTFLIKALCLLYLLSYQNSSAQIRTDTIIGSKHFIRAEILLADWKMDSAVTVFEKAIPVYEKANYQNRVADAYDKIAEAHRKNYNLNQALTYAKKSLALRQDIFGENHPETAYSYNSLGHSLKLQDQFKSALEYYQKALDIQLAAFGEKDYRVADCYHNIGNIYHLFAKYDKAQSFYNQALHIRLRFFGKKHHKIADSYIDIGTTYYHLAKNKEALQYYQNALAIIKVVFGDNSPEVGFCYTHIANILNHLGKFDEALGFQNKALIIIKNNFKSNHKEVGNIYYRIAIIYRYKGNYNIAIKYSKEALKIVISEIGKNHTHAGVIYNELGILYEQKGEYDKSLKFYLSALKINIKNRGPKHTYTAGTYNNIGLIYYNKGEYGKALSYYKRAINLFINSRGENSSISALVYNNIANTYKRKEEYNEALTYYKKALKIRLNVFGFYNPRTAYSNYDMAEVYKIRKEYKKAFHHYNNALKILTYIYKGPVYYISDMHDAIGVVYGEKKEYSKAIQVLKKSIEIRLQTDGIRHPRTAKTYNYLGNAYAQSKKYNQALQHYNKAISANTKSKTRQQEFESNNYLDLNALLSSLQGKAKTFQHQYNESNNLDKLTSGIITYKKADALIDNIRKNMHTYRDKVNFAKQAQNVYQDAIAAQLLLYKVDQNKPSLEKAFYYAEKSRANTLKSLLSESSAKNFAGLPATLLDQEQQLKAEHTLYTSKIVNAQSNTTPDTTKINSYESTLFDIDRQRDSLIQIVEKKYPKYYQLKHQNKIVSIQNIQEKLSDSTTVLEFFTSDSISYAFTISKNDFNITTLSTPTLTKNIEQLREAIASKNTISFKKVSHKLYTNLIYPIKHLVTGDELIIVPDGPLWHLNFELLLTKNNSSNDPKKLSYLLKEYAISYGNSATLLFESRNNVNATKKEECLAFSFSDSTTIVDTKTMSLAALRNTKDDLPGTRKEIMAISEIINGNYYYGSQAIEANFKKNAGQYNILHLAMHGAVDHKNPENSRLLFTKSKDTIEDNLLYGHELFALDIPAELTVLSACNTGSGKIAKGEGIMSLGNAFQYAGTKSLLLSSWEVSDHTTPELMKHFYSNLKEGMNKAKALQQAKLTCLSTANVNRSDPFYWGGFYLVGDPSPMEFSKSYSMYYWIVGIVVLCIITSGLFLYKKKLKHS